MVERRKRPRERKSRYVELALSYTDYLGGQQKTTVKVLDVSEDGLGVEARVRLSVGSVVSVTGHLPGGHRMEAPATVASSSLRDGGAFRIGLCFEGFSQRNPFWEKESQQQRQHEKPDLESGPFVDFYEVLQVSPNAEPETIHRVYRLLAQRYHPDNTDTGDEEVFKNVLRAYRVLSDPEQRATYDVRHSATRRLQWKIFEQPKAAQGMAAEKRKRQAILALLYTKRLSNPEQPALTAIEMEELLACPREHLEFSLWYLRENAWITRGDNGRYLITAKGVDHAEEERTPWPRQDRLLTTDSDQPRWDAMSKEAVPVA